MLPTRPIPPCMTDPPPFDPPKLISDAMGGRQFFFDVGARTVHRIGLLLGLGWRLPFGEARDHINLIKVAVDQTVKGRLAFVMGFWKIDRLDEDGCSRPEDAVFIREVRGVALRDLRSTYEQQTGATA